MRSLKYRPDISERAARLSKLARRLKAASHCRATSLPALWFLTDEARRCDPVKVALGLPPGSGIVLRHYRDPGRARLAGTLAGIARTRDLKLLIGADARLAAAVGAHGVHLPRWAQAHRPIVKVAWLVTVSAHGLCDLAHAARLGADAAFLAPVFPTLSHGGAQGIGPVRLSKMTHAASLPIFALGGIDERSATRLMGTGVAGIGAIGALAPSTE